MLKISCNGIRNYLFTVLSIHLGIKSLRNECTLGHGSVVSKNFKADEITDVSLDF